MRKAYRATRNRLVDILTRCPLAQRLTIREENAGLHFLVTLDTALPGEELVARCDTAGIRIQPLAGFYHGNCPPDAHRTLVVNYAGLRDEDLDKLEAILSRL